MEFTDAEIREELARLGYKDVPNDKLYEFKKDLMRLIHAERSKSNSLNSSIDETKGRSKSKSIKSNEFAAGNFTNHSNQWLRTDFKEDWQGYGDEIEAATTRSVPDILRRAQSAIQRSHSHNRFPVYHENVHPTYDSYSQDGDSESETGKRVIKRKTARKNVDGQITVDESFNTENVETADVIDMFNKVKRLAVRDCECGKTRKTSSDTQPPYRLQGLNINPSVILPRFSDPPHLRNLDRCVPFKRLQMYQKLWKAQPAIGEDHRHQIRKEVHAKMLSKDEIVSYHKVFVPNPYVVPTEKARYDLRWNVRRANSNFEMPIHGYYHEV